MTETLSIRRDIATKKAPGCICEAVQTVEVFPARASGNRGQLAASSRTCLSGNASRNTFTRGNYALCPARRVGERVDDVAARWIVGRTACTGDSSERAVFPLGPHQSREDHLEQMEDQDNFNQNYDEPFPELIAIPDTHEFHQRTEQQPHEPPRQQYEASHESEFIIG
jgi:hypothetical protein